MSWLLIIPLMIVCLFLNIRVYLAMFIGIIAYFLFFSSVPIEIAVQRLIAPTQSPSLLAIPFFILLGTLMSQRSGGENARRTGRGKHSRQHHDGRRQRL